MAGEARPGFQDRIAAAYDVFARERGRTGRSGLQVAAAARAVGAPRSQFYRYWETGAELDEDVAVHRATSDATWPMRVMADGDPNVFEAIRRAVQAPDAASGATVRAVLAAEPAGTAAHNRLQAWEARWLRWLAERVRSQLGDDPAVPWTAAATTVTALVEGTLLVRGPRLTGATAPLDPAFAAVLADVAAGVAANFAAHVTGPDPGLDAGTEPEVRHPDAARRLLDRVVVAIDEEQLLSSHSEDRRLISPPLLAKELGVSTRWVYECWPVAVDFNADIFGEALVRLGRLTDEAALSAFLDAGVTDPTNVTPVLVRVNERLMDIDHLTEPLVLLALMDLLEHADVGGLHGEVIQRWFESNQMRAAAILQSTGRRLIPQVGIAEYSDLAGGAGVGGWRMCAAHRDLLAQRCTYLGEEFLAIGVGLDTVTQACIHPTDGLAT